MDTLINALQKFREARAEEDDLLGEPYDLEAERLRVLWRERNGR